jgi:hypothetical protein
LKQGNFYAFGPFNRLQYWGIDTRSRYRHKFSNHIGRDADMNIIIAKEPIYRTSAQLLGEPPIHIDDDDDEYIEYTDDEQSIPEYHSQDSQGSDRGGRNISKKYKRTRRTKKTRRNNI